MPNFITKIFIAGFFTNIKVAELDLQTRIQTRWLRNFPMVSFSKQDPDLG